MPHPSFSPLVTEAWARATIHLNLGEPDVAAEHAAIASRLTDWTLFGDYQKIGPACVFGSYLIPRNWLFLHPVKWRALIHVDTFAELGWSIDLHRAAEAVMAQGPPVFLPIDPQLWALNVELDQLLTEEPE